MRNAPCLNCERRGCGSYHDECEKYKAFVEEYFEKQKAGSKH